MSEVVQPPAFSNGSMFSSWQSRYCDTCWHDRASRRGDEANGCEWIALGMVGEVVPGWVEADPPTWVHCVAWTPDDGGDDEGIPEPPPQCGGQLSLADALVQVPT